MFGDVTPNSSIRLRNTSKAETIDSSTFVSKTACASLLDIFKSISPTKDLLAKISGDANFLSPSISSNAVKKSSK